MSEVMKQSEMRDDSLSWQAFCYVSGEMSDTEVVEFEARLNPESPLFELEVCEAVARAVQLNDAVAEATEPVVDRIPVVRQASPAASAEDGRRDVFARRVSLAAASITVLAVGWVLTSSPSPQTFEVVDHPSPLSVEDSSDVSGELVQIWADSGNELLSAGEEVQIQPVDDTSEFVNDDVPDWLLAAVQSHNISTAPEVMEN